MTEIQILNLLSIKPMYGVEMIEEIKRLSGNVVVMSLPTLYSSLHKLAAKKFVNSYWQEAEIGGRRHVYNITKAGREYREKNKIEINYALLKEKQTQKSQTYASLEEAFSLPLNNQPVKQPENIDDKRVLRTEPVSEAKPKPTPKTTYIVPTEKITTNTEAKHKQMSMNLTGTTGSANLRPLLKLNQILVGNDFVAINRLRVVAAIINLIIFVLVNFFCSLLPTAQKEYYELIYIGLGIYFAVIFAIYFIFPKVKMMFNCGRSFRWHALVTIGLAIIVIVICVSKQSLNLIWLALFAFIPVVESLLMMILRKGKVFRC